MAEEFQKRDIFKLSSSELKSHIQEIQSYRLSRPDWPPISANECSYLLMLAHGELQGRSADKVAKIALIIAFVSVLLTLAQLFLS